MLRVPALCFITLLASFPIAAQIRAIRDAESANILTIEKTVPDPKIKIESVTGYPDRSSLVKNRAGTFSAFVLCVPTDATCASSVFFKNSKTGDTFMIGGEPDEVTVMRPISELKWLDNDRLSYERWMNPHYGHRYIVNVKLKKQTAAYSITDIR